MQKFGISLDRNIPVDVFYMDVIKTFDQVPHDLLVHKLQVFGIQGPIARWISGWLANRTQSVVINGMQSHS